MLVTLLEPGYACLEGEELTESVLRCAMTLPIPRRAQRPLHRNHPSKRRND